MAAWRVRRDLRRRGRHARRRGSARTKAGRSRAREWAELCMDGTPVSCEYPRRRRIGGLEGGRFAVFYLAALEDSSLRSRAPFAKPCTFGGLRHIVRSSSKQTSSKRTSSRRPKTGISLSANRCSWWHHALECGMANPLRSQSGGRRKVLMPNYVILMTWTDQGSGPTGTPWAVANTPMPWQRSTGRG